MHKIAEPRNIKDPDIVLGITNLILKQCQLDKHDRSRFINSYFANVHL